MLHYICEVMQNEYCTFVIYHYNSNMRQATCLKDEVLKFQLYDDPYTLASSDAITSNFDDIDI